MKGRLLLSMVAVIAFTTSNAVAGISGGAKSAGASQLILTGPVEAIKEREGIVVVLGQKLPLRALGRVEIGQTVSVFGTANSDGSLVISQVQAGSSYVPGATAVVLTAIVQKINAALGRATVGGLNVDITSLNVIDPTQALAVGTVVQVSGTQPSSGGLILAQGISGGASTQGISGGANLQGISGGANLQGISGGAKTQGISGGASTQGISGGA